MFAVPGWSVSADSLKAEKASSTPNRPNSASRKRKRAGGQTAEVNTSNVSDLFDSVVTGNKSGVSGDEKVAKRQRNSGDAGIQEGRLDRPGKSPKKGKGTSGETKLGGKVQRESNNQEKEKKKPKKQRDISSPSAEKSATPKVDSSVVAKTQAAPPTANLTPLQASMREKLVSARFRHLNESLYTRPSDEAYQLFAESPEMFGEYHEGFRRQVKVWPQNPVDGFLSDIRTRAKVRSFGKGRPGASQPASTPLIKTVLPRTQGTCVIADLGCGDARLAESLQGERAKLRLDIKSFDLQSPSALVTKADIANLPLEDGAVNVAIFCLALMGTNWIDFIEEANRILHWKGELWIAEIKSRFAPAGRGKNAVVSHSVGNRKKLVGKKAKGQDAEEEVLDGESLAVEVDGNDDRRRETDVSAFVEVLKKRGFVLQRERSEAIDMSNKMFVTMRFIKGASPSKGKGVKAQDKVESKRPLKAWLDNDKDDEETSTANEASILKPCVYKIR